jgi:hypothetical protein
MADTTSDDGFIPGANGGGMIRPRRKGDPAPPGAGRPKGSENTKTKFARWLACTSKVVNPVTGQIEEISLHDQLILGQITKGIFDQDTQAFNAVFDRFEGKVKQDIGVTNETFESAKRFEHLTADQIRDILDGKEVDQAPPEEGESDGRDVGEFTEYEDVTPDDPDTPF